MGGGLAGSSKSGCPKICFLSSQRRGYPLSCPDLIKHPCNGRNKSIAMFGYGLDKARTGGIVAELAADGFDALGQGFIGNGNAAPDLFKETILRHEFALFAHEQ